MTVERRKLPPEKADPFVATLARILREIADREDAERGARRATMELVQGRGNERGEAA